MEIVKFAKDLLHNVAEQAVSYRFGQTVLRYLDRALWVLEKTARWAVPPPLDQDERPQPELVRPLPWMFFLTLIVILRVTRESLSLVNLALGKPPVRSADVVIYIQSKRRYLRTLKYQGNRAMRARATSSQPQESWYRNLHSLFEFTMCFRRNSYIYGNNNTTSVSNNDEVLVVKRCKRVRQTPAVAGGEPAMEKLIEKMMVDLDAESDLDAEPLIIVNSKSDSSIGTCESDAENSVLSVPTKSNDISNASTSEITDVRIDVSPPKPDHESTPEKVESVENASIENSNENASIENSYENASNENAKDSLSDSKIAVTQIESKNMTPKEESIQFILNEKCTPIKSKKTPMKMANGQAIKGTPSKKRGKLTLDGSLEGRKENMRHHNSQ